MSTPFAMKAKEARKLMGKMMKGVRRNKYGAKPTVVDGIRFASQKEALRYVTLKQMERAGEIAGLELQHPIELIAFGVGDKLVVVGRYICDFKYFDRRRDEPVYEDVKGVRTDVYKLKKKIVEANYGIAIREV